MREITASCICKTGKVRTNNEDNFLFGRKYLSKKNRGLVFQRTGRWKLNIPRLFAVFDGMGGEACGEAASFITAEVFAMNRCSKDPEELCAAANRAVCGYAGSHMTGTMGSTVVCAQFKGDEVTVCNLGDSRAYVFDNGLLRQVSVDHNETAFPDDNAAEKQKTGLTQYIGIPEDQLRLEPSVCSLQFRTGMLLLCSDGLTDMVSDGLIQEILRSDDDIRRLTKRLYLTAMENGGRDNITIILCKTGQGRKEITGQ